jgi:hypothetical protein
MEQQVLQSHVITQNKEFYEDAARYWEKIPATINGMLGDYGFISKTDIIGSKEFLKSLFEVTNFFLHFKCIIYIYSLI